MPDAVAFRGGVQGGGSITAGQASATPAAAPGSGDQRSTGWPGWPQKRPGAVLVQHEGTSHEGRRHLHGTPSARSSAQAEAVCG